MTLLMSAQLPVRFVARSKPPVLPAWASAWVNAPLRTEISTTQTTLRRAIASHYSIIEIDLAAASLDNAAQLEARVTEAYRLLQNALQQSKQPHPIRVWNFVPSIHAPMDDRRDRYMVFNAGRFQAYRRWFGERSQLAGRVPTASAVGWRGRDLRIVCLAQASPGEPIENPRQVPAFEYSDKFGPLPPCFSRGMIVQGIDGVRKLLVGGTASIRGEQSVHAGDRAAQWQETLTNLRALLMRAQSHNDSRVSTSGDAHLDAFSEVRVYFKRTIDRAWIARQAKVDFPQAASIELIRADICRADLLLEIEGAANLTKATAERARP